MVSKLKPSLLFRYPLDFLRLGIFSALVSEKDVIGTIGVKWRVKVNQIYAFIVIVQPPPHLTSPKMGEELILPPFWGELEGGGE